MDMIFPLFFPASLVLIITRAAILDSVLSSAAILIQRFFPISAVSALEALSCPMCVGFWVCLVSAALTDWRFFPAQYLLTVLLIAAYDKLSA